MPYKILIIEDKKIAFDWVLDALRSMGLDPVSTYGGHDFPKYKMVFEAIAKAGVGNEEILVELSEQNSEWLSNQVLEICANEGEDAEVELSKLVTNHPRSLFNKFVSEFSTNPVAADCVSKVTNVLSRKSAEDGDSDNTFENLYLKLIQSPPDLMIVDSSFTDSSDGDDIGGIRTLEHLRSIGAEWEQVPAIVFTRIPLSDLAPKLNQRLGASPGFKDMYYSKPASLIQAETNGTIEPSENNYKDLEEDEKRVVELSLLVKSVAENSRFVNELQSIDGIHKAVESGFGQQAIEFSEVKESLQELVIRVEDVQIGQEMVAQVVQKSFDQIREHLDSDKFLTALAEENKSKSITEDESRTIRQHLQKAASGAAYGVFQDSLKATIKGFVGIDDDDDVLAVLAKCTWKAVNSPNVRLILGAALF